MNKTSRPYRVVLEGAKPEDLARRCAAVWAEVLGVSARIKAEERACDDSPLHSAPEDGRSYDGS